MANKDTDTRIDYDHWSRFAAWTFEQAAALSLGIDPHAAVSPESPEALRASYKKRLEVIDSYRFLSSRFPKSGCVEPSLFLAWAKTFDIDVPIELMNAVAIRNGMEKNWNPTLQLALEMKSKEQRIAELEAECTELERAHSGRFTGGTSKGERALVPKEEQSLLKLVLGMAIAKYNYKPLSGNSSAPGRIVASLEKCEIHITEETTLTWLRIAAEQIEFKTPE